MPYPRSTFLGPVRRIAAAAGLALVVSCSLSDDDDGDSDGDGNGDNPAATAGTAGSGISLGGRDGGGGSTGQSGQGSGAAGSSSNGPPACENIAAETNKCGGSSVNANFKTVNILLVIDKSGSMDDRPTGFDNNKWVSLKQALDAALTPVAKDVNIGLLLYPFSLIEPIQLACTERCCEVPVGVDAINVPIAPGLESVGAVLDALDATSPGGGTPTADALQGAIDYFTKGDGLALEGERYVLLATDGGPNCNTDNSCGADRCTTNLDNQCSRPNCCEGKLAERCLDDVRVTEKVQTLKDAGIGTFVVGIPGTEAYASYLDAFAEAGGFVNPAPDSRKYYEVKAEGGVEGLVDVFNTITTQLVRACDIELANPPLDTTNVRLYVDCEGIPRGEEDDPNWEIDIDVEPSVLRLKGDSCTRISNQGAERVDVIFGCPPIR
jgi:hypothetical protein